MSWTILRKWSHLRRVLQRNKSALIKPKAAAGFCTATDGEAYVTPESNPANHTKNDIGLIYKIDNSLSWDCLFQPSASLEPEFFEECKTFGATYFMIRKPALEIIHYLKHANYDNPINKYVLYGKYGHGVTTTMMHVLHYAHLSGWCIVHVPSVITWLVKKTERTPSTTHEGLIDLPILGSNWLSHFKNQNLKLIDKLDLRLENDYTWNIQEENKKGESLLSLIDHGIVRGKYSSDVITALLQELKQFARAGKVKILLAIDLFSTVFHPGRVSTNHKIKYLAPQQLSFIDAFMDMAKADWHNGAALLSCVSDKLIRSDIEHFPLNKLSRKGFEFLDPFVPVEVPRLTEAEMTSLLAFYKSQKWMSITDVDEELKILSAGSMRTLKRLCAPL